MICIHNEAMDLLEIDSKFVMGMMFQSRDKNRCYCNC